MARRSISKTELTVPEMAEPKPRDADDLLGLLGTPGKFQQIQFVVLSLQFLPISMSDLIPIIYNLSPIGLRLYGEDLTMNISLAGYLNRSAALCHVMDQNWTRKEYVYQNSRQWSVIAEMDLICRRKWLANFATTLFFLGQIFGSPLTGWIADKYGRRPTLAGLNVAFTLLNVALVFSRDYVSFAILRFFVGVVKQGMHSVFYILLVEWTAPRRRGAVTAMAMFPVSLGVVVLALVAFLVQDWRYLQIVLALSNFSALSFYWFAPESLKWLSMKKRYREMIGICEKVAQFNGIALEEEKLYEMNDPKHPRTKKEEGVAQTYSTKDILKSKYLRLFMLLCCYIWFATMLSYFGFSYLMNNLVGDIYSNLAISGCLEFVPRILGIVVANKLTNRAILTGYFTVSGILAIVTAVIPVHNTIDARASTAMALLGRMFIVGCLPVVSVVSTELFPTVVRNIGFGWCSVMMRVGAMLAPQLGLLDGITSFVGLPYLIIGVVSLLGTAVSIVLPETTDMRLMSTIEQAETFGEREVLAFWRRVSVPVLPILKRHRKSIATSSLGMKF